MPIDELHSIFLECDGISTDTRSIKVGSIFFGIKGESFDGNDYVIEALEKGASYAVTTNIEHKNHPRFIDQIILVDDTVATLQKLSNFHRKKFQIPVIGITGTNGKTTTKELVSEILIEKYRIIKSEGNKNNHIGVPLTLLRIKSSTEIAVVEMGANHINDISDLCKIAEPTHGLITNIGLAHIEGFGSIEGVAKAKGALYEWIRDHNGTIFVNKNDNVLTSLLYKIDSGCKAQTVRYGSEIVPDNQNLFGSYNKENMKAAAAIGKHFRITMGVIVKILKNFTLNNMRSQKIETLKGNDIILDAYNANPSSMKAALYSFAELRTAKPKWLILGDMKELGDQTETFHSNLLNDITFYGFTNAILIGDELNKAHEGKKQFACFKNKDEFLSSPFASSIKNSVVLIKGSNGMKMWEISDSL